ncbi:hypothetical protein [Candidatus Albibeggiatoa sp. nov. BB20]|uniref:hypothetical protein n=1 Tax=Candidatus Albibeggiatoa sp. nov. BB20 TaxID=3162723 RepID=UPI003365A66C
MQEYIKTYLDTAQQLAALKSQESEIAAQIKQLQTIQDSLINDYLEPYYLNELKAAKDAKLQTNQGEVYFKTRRSTTLIVANEQDLLDELRALNHR